MPSNSERGYAAGRHNYDMFREPIHDYIRVRPVDKAIIDCQPFQRLRYLRQLGLYNVVYQGAEHHRLTHSLGTTGFAGRIFDTLLCKTSK